MPSARWLCQRQGATRFRHTAATLAAAPSICFAAALLILTAVYATHLWAGYKEAWIHPEPIRTAHRLWSPLDDGHSGGRLSELLDFRVFDNKAMRLRLLNDLAEGLEALWRPHLARYFVPHPSITPLGLLIALAVPILTFGILHRITGYAYSLALTALLISSAGFLSVTVPYIHPAKRLALLSLALALYLAQRYQDTRRITYFWGCILTLFLFSFSDEMALVNYAVVGLMYARPLILSARLWQRIAFLAFPRGLLSSIHWVIPRLYASFGYRGWDAQPSYFLSLLLPVLVKPDFYKISLIHITRALLVTVGIYDQRKVVEVLGLVLLLGGTSLLVFWGSRTSKARGASYGAMASAAALVAAGFWATFVGWFPFPGQVNYLGSFTYYYHSSLGVLVILWLGHAGTLLGLCLSSRDRLVDLLRRAGLGLCAAVVILNFREFHHLNQAFSIIHTYPFASRQIYEQLAQHIDLLRDRQSRDPVVLHFSDEHVQLAAKFDADLDQIYGPGWQRNDYVYFHEFRVRPMMSIERLRWLVEAYFPGRTVYVEVVEVPRAPGVA